MYSRDKIHANIHIIQCGEAAVHEESYDPSTRGYARNLHTSRLSTQTKLFCDMTNDLPRKDNNDLMGPKARPIEKFLQNLTTFM